MCMQEINFGLIIRIDFQYFVTQDDNPHQMLHLWQSDREQVAVLPGLPPS